MSSAALGKVLREARARQGHSLSDVARATQLSPSFLSLVENGKSDISFGRLMRLARFYEISLADLMEEEESPVSTVLRGGTQPEIVSAGERFKIVLLAANKDSSMMPMLIVYEPGGGSPEYESHYGEEFVHVLEGQLTLDLNGTDVALQKGDSAYYRSEQPHRYRNESEEPAVMLFVVTPPGGLTARLTDGDDPLSG